MKSRFQFYSSCYNFIASPDLINLNTGEVKYDSDWYKIPD